MTLTKDGGIKTVSSEESIAVLLANGWKEIKEVKEAKRGKSTKSTSK